MSEEKRLRAAIKISAAFSMFWGLGLTLAICLTIPGLASMGAELIPTCLGIFGFVAVILVAILRGAYCLRPWAKFVLTGLLALFAWIGETLFYVSSLTTLLAFFPLVLTSLLLWRAHFR